MPDYSSFDLVFLVPPMALPGQPSMAAHLLQACALRDGLRVKVVYANALLARELGDDYRLAAQGSYSLVGERLFARAAHGLPPLGRWAENTYDWAWMFGTPDYGHRDKPFIAHPAVPPLPLGRLYELETQVTAWVERFADELAGSGCRAFACTTSYEQTNASFALLGALKRRRPDALTLVGGANAEGLLADGLASLDPDRRAVDAVFSGETEDEFVAVLSAWKANGARPVQRVIRGRPRRDLDALPPPEFSDYWEAQPQTVVDIPYETSRGCWWGGVSPCLFCGFEPEKLAYRTVSADRVFADWSAWAARHPGLRIQTTDLIMPKAYFDTLLPRLAAAQLPLRIYWEEKADLDWNQMKLLRAAGVMEIQPGIENFNLELLGRLHKGARPAKSLNLIRYAAIWGIRVYWNLLWGIPGETVADYGPTLRLFRLVPHLPPPFGLSQALVLRFSAYQRDPRRWGFDRLDPVRTFEAVYPPGCDLANLVTVYHPTYKAETLTDPGFVDELTHVFTEWTESWWGTENRRTLVVFRQSAGAYLLVDTRRLEGCPMLTTLDEAQARAALVSEAYTGTDLQLWAIEGRLAVVLDGEFVPLALTTPEVMEGFLVDHP